MEQEQDVQLEKLRKAIDRLSPEEQIVVRGRVFTNIPATWDAVVEHLGPHYDRFRAVSLLEQALEKICHFPRA
jgi:hypothetical protein